MQYRDRDDTVTIGNIRMLTGHDNVCCDFRVINIPRIIKDPCVTWSNIMSTELPF